MRYIPSGDGRGLLMCQRPGWDDPCEHRRCLDVFCVGPAIDERTAHHETCNMDPKLYGDIFAMLYDIPRPVAAQNSPSAMHSIND